jgi:hypothetical protein
MDSPYLSPVTEDRQACLDDIRFAPGARQHRGLQRSTIQRCQRVDGGAHSPAARMPGKPIFAGDMAMADCESAVTLIGSMPGRKVLVAGNHDLSKDGKCRLAREKDLFDAVMPFLFWLGGLGRMVMVTRYPVAVTANETSTLIIHYHGQLHQNRLENTSWVKLHQCRQGRRPRADLSLGLDRNA